jgi:hypothetical protein
MALRHNKYRCARRWLRIVGVNAFEISEKDIRDTQHVPNLGKHLAGRFTVDQ